MGEISRTDFKTYYLAAVMMTTWYWQRDRHVDQWNRMENQETDSHKYRWLTFDRVQKQFNRGRIIFST